MNQPLKYRSENSASSSDLDDAIASAISLNYIHGVEWVEIQQNPGGIAHALHFLPTGIVEHEGIDEDNKAGMGAVIGSYDLDGKRRDIQ